MLEPWDLAAVRAQPPVAFSEVQPSGVKLVLTEPMQRLVAYAQDALLEGGRTIAVSGPSGCGKTTLLQAVVQAADVRTVLVTVPAKATNRAFWAVLCRTLGLADRGTGEALAARVARAVRTQPTVLIVDEAQHLGRDSLLRFRYLKKESNFQLGLILAGSDLFRMLTSQPVMRIDRRVVLGLRKVKDMRADLVAFHPAFEQLGVEVLEWADREHIHGAWAEWRAFLSAMLQTGTPEEHDGDDYEAAAQALEQVYGDRPQSRPARRAA